MDWQEPQGWPEDAAADRLIGDWHIYQRKGGHRTSTDDLITAWYAIHRRPQRPERYLDLGCGIGSVMLMVSYKLQPGVSQGVEAQPQSAAMAQRSIQELPEHTCDLRVQNADFRDVDFGEQRFDLVTGSPPYFPLHTGVLPKDSQRRACRFEARGGVEVYLETAARALSETGRFYLVFPSRSHERVSEAAVEYQLFVTGRADFLMRADRDEPFLSVFEFARTPVESAHFFSCPVRDAEGEVSEAYQKIRVELGVS